MAQSGDAATPAGPPASTCSVTIDRTQAADSFRVDRQTLDSGQCVCYVYTGPTTQSAETEARVTDIQQRGTCETDVAPFIADGSQFPAGAAAAGAAGIGIAALLAGSGGNDSPGG